MCSGRVCGCGFCHAHTYAATLTGAEYLGTLIGGHGLWYIDEDVAAVLHQVLLFLAKEALASAVDLLNRIQRIVRVVRAEVDEGIIQEGLVVACLGMTVFVEVCTIMRIFVVIHTVCATEYLLHASLDIFHIG